MIYIERLNHFELAPVHKGKSLRVALKFSFPLTLLIHSAVSDISIAYLFLLHLVELSAENYLSYGQKQQVVYKYCKEEIVVVQESFLIGH